MAVERLLRQTVMGEPALQISRVGCPTLIRSMGNYYRYRRRRDGQLDDLPEKLHPWSDICDAMQYFCLGTQANLTGRVLARERRFFQGLNAQPAVSAAGWT
jgi:hypothetical protein